MIQNVELPFTTRYRTACMRQGKQSNLNVCVAIGMLYNPRYFHYTLRREARTYRSLHIPQKDRKRERGRENEKEGQNKKQREKEITFWRSCGRSKAPDWMEPGKDVLRRHVDQIQGAWICGAWYRVQ